MEHSGLQEDFDEVRLPIRLQVVIVDLEEFAVDRQEQGVDLNIRVDPPQDQDEVSVFLENPIQFLPVRASGQEHLHERFFMRSWRWSNSKTWRSACL